MVQFYLNCATNIYKAFIIDEMVYKYLCKVCIANRYIITYTSIHVILHKVILLQKKSLNTILLDVYKNRVYRRKQNVSVWCYEIKQ
jgi:hypothetical protein